MNRKQGLTLISAVVLSIFGVAACRIWFHEPLPPQAQSFEKGLTDMAAPKRGSAVASQPVARTLVQAQRAKLGAAQASDATGRPVGGMAMPQEPQERRWARAAGTDLTTDATAVHGRQEHPDGRVMPAQRFRQLVEGALNGGMSLPLAYGGKPDGEAMSAVEESVLRQTIEEFIRDLEPLAHVEDEKELEPGLPEEIWENARNDANARYRLLFGFEAFNRALMQDSRVVSERGE